MQIQNILKVASSVIIATTVIGCNSTNNDDNNVSMDLRLMETTDIHTNIMPYNYFVSAASNEANMPDWGLARTAIVIESTRAEVDNHMLFDNGDLIQGSPMGDYMAKLGTEHLQEGNTHPVYKAMNALGYDAANLGNHEFNYGLEYLEETLEGSDFPYVSANVWAYDDELRKAPVVGNECEAQITEEFYEQAGNMYDPYVILAKNFIADNGATYEVNVGVIGFTPPAIMGWDASHLTCKVLVSDITKTAEYFVPKMKAEGADIIVAIPHSGLTASEEEFSADATWRLAYVDGIDALMFGHDHREFPNDNDEYGDIEGVDPKEGKINGVPAIMPGFWGAKLGVIDLKLTSSDKGETWSVKSSTAELRDLVDGQSSEEIEELVEEEHTGTVEYMAETIAEIDVNVNSFFPQLVPDLSIQIVNEAQYHQLMKWKEAGEFEHNDAIFLSVSAPFKGGRNGADDYTNIQQGELTNASIADLYVFDNNTPAVIQITGKGLKEWIDWTSSNTYNQLPLEDGQTFLVESFPGYNFDVFYGGFDDNAQSRLQYIVDVKADPAYDIGSENETDPTGSTQVDSITFDGVEIADDQIVYVVTNNYRASSSFMPGIKDGEIVKEEAAFNNRELVQFYLTALLAEQDGNTKLEFVNAKNFTLKADGIASVDFASVATDADSKGEGLRCATAITGLSTDLTEVEKAGTPGYTQYTFDFDYSGNFDCPVKD